MGTMNRKKQRKALLRAAKWVASHPHAWNKKQFFGTETLMTTSTGKPLRGFDVMGATFPDKHYIFSMPNVDVGNKVVSQYVNRNFPDEVIGDVCELNDSAVNAEQAARKVRAYVGRKFPKNFPSEGSLL